MKKGRPRGWYLPDLAELKARRQLQDLKDLPPDAPHAALQQPDAVQDPIRMGQRSLTRQKRDAALHKPRLTKPAMPAYMESDA
jgi:hypothetical protein